MGTLFVLEGVSTLNTRRRKYIYSSYLVQFNIYIYIYVIYKCLNKSINLNKKDNKDLDC